MILTFQRLTNSAMGCVINSDGTALESLFIKQAKEKNICFIQLNLSLKEGTTSELEEPSVLFIGTQLKDHIYK